MIGGLLWLCMAQGAPSDALPPLVRDLYERAQQLEEQGEWSKAAAAYRLTWGQERAWTQALVDESRVKLAMGDVDGALVALRRAPYDPDTLEHEARLLLDQGEDRAAADVARRLVPLRPEWPEVHLLLAEALSRIDPQAADSAIRRYLEDEQDVDEAVVVRVTTDIVLALASAGRDEEAWALGGVVLQVAPDADALDTLLEKHVEREVADQAAALELAAAAPLSPVSVGRVREARAAMFAGRASDAVEVLHGVVAQEPMAVVAWSTLALAQEAAGDVDGAVYSARMAEELDPLDPETSARVGDLLATHYGGRLDAMAARAYARAVQRRGADPELWLRKARLEARAGWVTSSISSYKRVISLAPTSPEAEEAAVAVTELERGTPPDAVAPPGVAGRPPSIPSDAWSALHFAWAWQRRANGEDDALERAAEGVLRARELAPTWTRAVNLDAAIRLDRGDDAGALEQYRASLAIDDSQGAVWRAVSALLRQGGDLNAATEALDRAAELGEPSAVLARAERLADGWHLLSANAELERYRSLSVDDPQRVEAVSRHIRVRRGVIAAGLAGALLLGLGVPLWWRRRQRAGVGLNTLLERSPRSYPDVARILAAIRHEVIKHHTTVLEPVAHALEDGDDEPAHWAAGRLFGSSGAVPTFWSYLKELNDVGERAGLRLNLLHRDGQLSTLVEAMAELSTMEGRLHSQQPEVLMGLSKRLNEDAYRELGRRLNALCQLPIDEAFLRQAYESAAREGSDVSLELRLPEVPLVVRMYRQDLHDVLVNLLRNAIEAALTCGSDRVGVAVGIDEDWVTGLQRVEIRVLDDSPAPLTTAQIRGRFIGRGLGLAVDLVTRAAGAIHVEAETGWNKAVVVRLPRVEEEG